MEKNTILAVFLSTLFLILWWTYFQPASRKPLTQEQQPAASATAAPATAQQPQLQAPAGARTASAAPAEEKDVTVETELYKAVFTTRGASVKHWFLNEKNGLVTDLVLNPGAPALSTYPDTVFSLVSQKQGTLIFSATPEPGITVTKTYKLASDYLHTLTISIARSKDAAQAQPLTLLWNAGLGTDPKEIKENLGLTRVLGFPIEKPHDVIKFKPGTEHSAKGLQWVAIDNRYFLGAFLYEANRFDTITVEKTPKGEPPHLALSAALPEQNGARTYELQFYLGPKGYSHLKTLGLNLQHSVDFGWFGSLSKLALSTLQWLYQLTGNYGWGIVLLTIGLQIILFPLSLKSFKATIAMKQLQPHIKALQEKFKSDPKRLNMEMLNLYKTQKVNPLGGCLPMLLQLPIFWALFTALRNAYELRGAPWLLWVTDLSAPDTLIRIMGLPLNVLPLVMGIGMFFQQKLMSTATDPMQEKMMYFMPVIFTFIFWNFPSGLVLYWLINNIITVAEQGFMMKRAQAKA